MALYGSDVTASPEVQAFETAKGGVETRTPTIIPQSSGVFEMAAGLAAGYFNSKKENEQNKFVTDFYNKQLMVADAYSQGRIKSATHAQTQMRKNLIEAINANPNNAELAKQLLDIQGKLTGVTGAAGIVSDMTPEDRRREQLLDRVVQEGWAPVGANEQEMNDGYAAMLQQDRAKRDYEERIKTIDLQLKANTLDDANRKRLEAQRAQAQAGLMRESSGPQFQQMQTTLQQVLNTDLSPAEKMRAIQDHYAEWVNVATSQLQGVPSDQRTAFLKPFEMLKDNFLQYASGELELSTLETQNKTLMQAQQNMIMAVPELAALAARNALFDPGVFGGIITQQVNDLFLRNFGNKAAGNLDEVTVFGEGANFKESVRTELRTLEKGFQNPEKREEAVNYLNNFLEAFEVAEGSIRRDPKKGYALVEEMASPLFYKLIKEGGSDITQIEAAQNVLQTHFANEVWDMVKREFTDAKVFIQTNPEARRSKSEAVAAPEGVGVRSTSSGMEFFATDPNESRWVAKAAELNKTLKPVINKTVQAMSHLEGHQNYKQFWEQTGDMIMGADGDTNISGDAGDDLLMDDFQRREQPSDVDVPDHILNDEPLQQEIDSFVDEMGGDRAELYRMFQGESGFNSRAQNKSGATGLAQLMPATARELGYTTAQIKNMTPAQQMAVYKEYLRRWGYDGTQSLALMQAAPAYADKPDNFVVYAKGTAAHRQNPGWRPKGGGDITVGSIKAYYNEV